ncbi:MAG: hypothetical protein H6712_20680 [Myxococcales bacterium]|nr:hypothetical protein [Myxococcales bacterium]MCB9716294.1 hypothetical protein [Myxococcales bacterium]
MATRIFAVGLALAALVGLVFASASTLDFVQHLDRQVHDLHCSFAPGLVEADQESTGCQVTLLSPYSSVMRTSLWGGIPISLPAMAVFAFLLFRALELLLARPAARRTTAAIALASTAVPVLASCVMGYLAFTKLHAACKLCIGIYASSGLALVMALVAWLMARKEAAGLSAAAEPEAAPTPPRAALAWASAAGQAFGFVTVPVVVYALLVPDYSRFIGTCGALAQPDDPYEAMIPLGPQGKGVPTIEVLDPLCPSCRGFEERMHAAGLDAELSRKVLVFPLDSECNWMVTRSLHPGACRVSEGLLCAAEDPTVGSDAFVQWAFDRQEELTKAGAVPPKEGETSPIATMIAARFPSLEGCLGSAEVKSRLNKSMRWMVANQLPVMTPQLYVAGVKLCDEDTDLGLDFTLHHMLQRHAAGQLSADAPAPADAGTPALVPGSAAKPTAEPKARGKTKAPAKPKVERPTPALKAEPSKAEPSKAEPSKAEPSKAEPSKAEPEPLPGVEELPPPSDDDDDGGAQ